MRRIMHWQSNLWVDCVWCEMCIGFVIELGSFGLIGVSGLIGA
jgi:hypothetical protein